jgi:hypothetical protein
MENKEGRLSGLVTFCVGTVFWKTELKEIYNGLWDKEEGISNYWMALRKGKGTRIWKIKQWFVLSGKPALYWLWTCRNTDYEMKERTFQHFPHSRKYKIYISQAMHIDFNLQSNVTLLVFDVSHILSPDNFDTWPLILLLKHEIRKRERHNFVIFFLSFRTHGKCFYSVYFNVLLYSAF